MKKFLIGCGIVVILAIVLVCGCTMYFGAKGVKWTQNIQVAVEKTAALEADYPFTDPGLGTDVDAARFQDYLDIRQDIIDRTLAIPMVDKIMQAEGGNQPPDIGMGDVFGLMGQLPQLISDYEAILRTREMAPSEYSYFARMVLKAIKDGSDQGRQEFIPVWTSMSGNIDQIQQAIDQHNQSQPPNQQVKVDLNAIMDQVDAAPVSEANIQMVAGKLELFSGKPEMIWVEIILTTVISETLPQMMTGR